MAINNIINDQWQGHTHGEVEDALKALLAQMLQDIEAAGIPADGVTADMLAQSLQTLINGKYSKPGTGIPASDLEGNIPSSKLAQAVQTSLGKADSALQGVKDSSGNLLVPTDGVVTLPESEGGGSSVAPDSAMSSTSENTVQNKAIKAYVDAAIADKANSADLASVATSGSYNDLSNKPTIPTKFSDLVDDSDYITAQDVASIVVGSADVVITETESHICITFVTSSITVKVGNDEVSGISLHTDGTAHESEQLSISGNHLKANIGAALSGADASDYELSTDGTTYSSTATITVTNEAVSNASLYVRYKGAKTAGTVSDATLTLTAGSLSKTISLHYSYASGPYISASPATLSFSAASGSTTDAKTLTVTGYSLSAAIDVTVSTASPFAVSLDGTTFNSSVTIPKATAMAGATVYVRYTAGATGSTGTLTLESTGATSKTVTLAGAVATLTVSPSSLSFSTDQGVAVTQSFTIQGTNLTNGVTLSITGTDAAMFSLSKNSLTKAEAEAGKTITVTYNSSAAGNHSGSIAVNWDGTTQTISLSGTAAVAATSDAEGKFTKLDANGNTLYLKRAIVNDEKTTDVEVHQSNYDTEWDGKIVNTYGGNIVIPATVVVDGVTCNVVKIASNAFRYNNDGKTKLQSLTLPEGLTHIGMYFLYQAQAVTSVIIPSTVTTINGQFCCSATNLSTIDMRCAKNANFQTTWGNVYSPYCRGCSKLTSFVIPDKVTRIEGGSYLSFDGCTALTTITIGTDMATFTQLFQALTNVTKIYCRGTVPPKINSTSSTTCYITSTVYENAQVYVPTGYKQAYLDVVDGRTSNGKVWYPFEQYHALIEYNPD